MAIVPPAPPPGEYRTKRDMLRKFSYYASGLAIGFVLLGVFQKLRKEELLKRQQDAAQPAQASPLFPAPPPAEPTNAPVRQALPEVPATP
jgi:hypothetical protein